MRLSFRSVGERGERYPAWLKDLDGKSGVYLLKLGGELVYIGESHAGRLYGTITRHFQAWSRLKSYWFNAGFSEHDPGLVYERSSVEVAVIVTKADAAKALQDRLIRKRRPRDNLDGSDRSDAFDVPF